MNGDGVFFLLIFMFFLGIVQVLWAILQALITQNHNVRRHFAFYGVGVIIYFAVLYVMVAILELPEQHPILALHFVGSAFALASYHVYIVVTSIIERNAMLDQQIFAHQEMPFDQQ